MYICLYLYMSLSIYRPCVHAFLRECFGARVSAPDRARTFRWRRLRRVVRLAGVYREFGVQREHRRVEHRGRVEHVRGKCRFRPRRHVADALGRSSMRRGRCARRRRR